MPARARRGTAAALSAVTGAALLLTGCGPDGTAATAGSTTPTSATTIVAGASPSHPPRPSASPSAKPRPSARPSNAPTGSSTSPTADCTTRAEADFGPVIQLTAATATGTSLTAQKAEFVCGPDVPDDGYWQGAGSTTQYTLAPNATFELFDNQPVTVSKQVFLQVASGCLTSPSAVPQPHRCYGNLYAVTVGPGNTIASVSELFHP
ncbi:hypothetical protein P3T35_006407 [Kitasatospora sp. GP30]|uniref:hypothetical protein n=1 Tax=Kitasatospora sp. GP30 TaxID=3035084 RepID=UPI000C70D4BA|nr:hypothetical protein [Kitasatospora sp. GP30]MDH6144365.1 hypothetical protein [Kitasatospora sp. GP30]